MPYPNEMSCPLSNKQYDRTRSATREHDGKQYRVLYGKVAGTDKWEERSYRYNKDVWSEEAARAHCESHGGVSFEGISKFQIRKSDDERQIIYGIALEPGIPDTYGDIETVDEIEKTAHGYLSVMWEAESPDATGAEHEIPITGYPVESFIAPVDFYYDGTPKTPEYFVRKGSWVLAMRIEDKEEFEKAKNGEYTGFSIQGFGHRAPV